MCEPYYDWNTWQTYRAWRWIDGCEWIKTRLELLASHLTSPFPKPLTPVIASQLTEELSGEIEEIIERKMGRLGAHYGESVGLISDLLRRSVAEIDYSQLAEKFMQPYYHPFD